MSNSKFMDVIKFKFEREFGGILSNLYDIGVIWNGILFSSTEAAYHYEKAKFHGRTDIMKKMLQVKTGKDANKYSLHTACREWHDVKGDIMLQIMECKFRASAEYRSFLRPLTLYVEDTTCSYWDRGHDGRGDNLMGKIHQKMAETSLQVLIIGDIHTQGLQTVLQTELQQHTNKIYHIDTVTDTEATTKTIHHYIEEIGTLINYTHVILVTGACDRDLHGDGTSHETTLIQHKNSLTQTTTSLTRGQVLVTNIPPIGNNTHRISKEEATLYNSKTMYINKRLIHNVATPTLWKKCKSKRYANTEYFNPDCKTLNDNGKKKIVKSLVSSMCNL